jgi:hypothetical protein
VTCDWILQKKKIITSLAEQDMLLEVPCTSIHHPITLPTMLRQHLWQWEHQVMNGCNSVMLAVLADGGTLPAYVFLNHKIMPEDQLPRDIIVRCQTN